MIFLGLTSPLLHAQNLKLFDPSKNASMRPKKSKQKLATEYYASGEYQKAATLFQELYKENNSSYFYRYLLYCYVQLEEYKKAEKMIKKAAKDNDKTYKELADLGYIRLKKGDAEKAAKMFQDAIDELPNDKSAVLELANDFRARGQTELAEETYHKGQKMMGEEYQFENELAYLYYYLEQYSRMTDAYLNLLERQPKQLRVIEYRFQSAFRRDSEDQIYPYLKRALLQKIKKNSDAHQLSELLLWLSIQRKDFPIALIQAKSLDRRGGHDAYRVFDLSKVMLDHGDYELSIEALNYLVNLPSAKEQLYYPEAVQLLLSAKFQLLQRDNHPSSKDIEQLAADFTQALDELGISRYTISLVMDHAQFKNFYLHQSEKAIAELEDLISNHGLSKAEKAPVKLLLGDLYLLDNNPWDATLLFSQVEKDFKNDEIGFEARYRNAKLSFYIGEFDWAKAQLDVLKAATGKKIANDAMKLSLFIEENLDADSNTRALKLYGQAELLHLRKQDSLAFQTFDSIFMLSLYHEIFDNVWLREAEIHIENHNYEQAKTLLEKIVEQYPDGLLADDAIWKLANLELHEFHHPQQAMNWYKMILTKYPASIHVDEARTIYRSYESENKNPENHTK
jgi:tetratricopeptide (TPR) repeat protein